ncbi:hypothetical protein LCGC14_1545290, partial [marine sediment metagenome]
MYFKNMRITLSLLKEFLDIKQDPKDIAHLFTSAGIEVDKIENEKPSFTNVFSVKVLDVQKHPKADNLVIAKVTDGNQNFQVVCGAKNCRKDLITAFAKIRATLTDEKGNTFKVNKAKLRDVESFGMLCSANELKLSLEKDQILELDIDFEIGKDLSILADPTFEISLTPNLGHLMSAIGLAREHAVKTIDHMMYDPKGQKALINNAEIFGAYFLGDIVINGLIGVVGPMLKSIGRNFIGWGRHQAFFKGVTEADLEKIFKQMTTAQD